MVDLKALRKQIGVTQVEFCMLFRLPERAFQQWEQGHRAPHGAVCTLLEMIEADPEGVMAILEKIPVRNTSDSHNTANNLETNVNT